MNLPGRALRKLTPRALAAVVALGVGAMVGCTSDAPQTSDPTVRSIQQKQVGSVVLRFPAGSLGDVPLAALDGSLNVADRARIQQPDGAAAGATQLGSAGVEVGASAQTGSLITQGSVFLRSFATVQGNVTTAGTVTQQQGASVTGTVTTGATTTPHNVEEFAIPLASNPGQPVSLEPDVIRQLAPGSYGSLSVKSRARLKLSAGDYAFTTAMVETGAILEIDDGLGAVRLFLDQGLTWRGVIQTPSGGHPALLIVARGTQGVLLDAPFRGTAMAPAGALVLGPGGQPHEGSFVGKSIEVRADTRVVYRAFFRLQGVEAFNVPSPTTGPFGNPAFNSQGGFLMESTNAVHSVSSSGTVSQVYASPSPARFALDPAGERFAVYLDGVFEVHAASGALVASLAREPSGYGSFVPNTNLIFLPQVGSDPERPAVSQARFYSPAGLQTSFAARLLVSRLTTDRLFYATLSQFVRASFAGTESFRLPLALATFEVSKNGRLAAGLRKQAGTSELVIVDTDAGTVLGSRVLPSTLWNIAVAPSGRYVAASTQNRVFLFDKSQLIREVTLPVEWCVSIDVNDQGVIAVGTQLASHASRIYLLGTPGTGAWSQDRSIERSGYRPSPRFAPSGNRFTLNENTRLTVFDIQRTR